MCHPTLQAWAFAVFDKIGTQTPWMKLLPAVADRTDHIIDEFTGQDISNLLWACSELGKPSIGMLRDCRACSLDGSANICEKMP